MNLKEYAHYASLTRAELGNRVANNVHMIFGMITEVGELTDAFKKWIAYGKELDWVNVKEEVGDLMWYVVNFCELNNLNLDEILETNTKKLKARYERSFSSEAALHRDLETERKILESK